MWTVAGAAGLKIATVVGVKMGNVTKVPDTVEILRLARDDPDRLERQIEGDRFPSEYLAINPTGAKLWPLLIEGATEERLVATLEALSGDRSPGAAPPEPAAPHREQHAAGVALRARDHDVRPGPVERHGEEEAQRRDRAVDPRRPHADLRLVQLETTKILSGGRPRKAASASPSLTARPCRC